MGIISKIAENLFGPAPSDDIPYDWTPEDMRPRDASWTSAGIVAGGVLLSFAMLAGANYLVPTVPEGVNTASVIDPDFILKP